MSLKAVTPLNILVVEPDDDVRETFMLVLESMGHKGVMTATDKDALSLAAVFRPDAILIAIGLQDERGIALCAALRQHCPSPVKLIAVFGCNDPAQIRAAYTAGVDQTLIKPIPLVTLLTTLQFQPDTES